MIELLIIILYFVVMIPYALHKSPVGFDLLAELSHIARREETIRESD